MTRHVVMLSGGVGSWAAGRRVVDEHGPEHVHLLFADTLIEDPDLYRFLGDVERDLQLPIERVADGRDPWEVFESVRMIGNTRADPCSRVLKRELLRRWLVRNCEPDETLVHLGIDWTEAHRIVGAGARWAPWRVHAPLCEPPLLDKPQLLEALEARGIEVPQLYALGFPHNNCGGFCVKAGQAQFERLLRVFPDRYRWHEQREQDVREQLGDVAILRDRTGGATRPLTLRAFRERLEQQPTLFDGDEWGGCGCAVDL